LDRKHERCHAVQQQQPDLPGLEPGDDRRGHRLLRRGFGIYHRWHGIRGQGSGRKTSQVVFAPEDYLPVGQAEAGQCDRYPVPGAV